MNARRRSSLHQRASFSTPRLKPHFLIACWTSSWRQSLTRRADKDYSPDSRPSEFPKFDGRKIARSATEVTPWQLFDTWVKARQPAASGVNRWRCVFVDLEQRFGN